MSGTRRRVRFRAGRQSVLSTQVGRFARNMPRVLRSLTPPTPDTTALAKPKNRGLHIDTRCATILANEKPRLPRKIPKNNNFKV